MIKLLIKSIFLLFLFSCSQEKNNSIEEFVTGAKIAGVNGIHFGPDGMLYAASVIGSDISVINTETGEILKRYGIEEGVIGPDDVAFNSKGEFYWTSILTGEVAGFNQDGEKIIAGNPGIGVNPITFSDDDRLFVAQCFYNNGIFELDPSGNTQPRIILEELGKFCGLNGMDWGPDGRLYGPRWFNNEVVSIDVETGMLRKEASGFNVPAAVKFNSKDELHVLDTGAGKVFKVINGNNIEVATISTGLDNLAINASDEIFVSSYSEGSILKVGKETIEEILPGGISHAGGISIYADDVVVADIQSVKAFSTKTGLESWNYKNTFRVAPLGANTAVSTFEDYVILTSWVDNTLKIMKPESGEILGSLEGLNVPVSATKFKDSIAVALDGDGTITLFSFDNKEPIILASGFLAPTHVINYEDGLLVSDRELGELILIDANGKKSTLISDLNSPEGLAIRGNSIYVFEGDTGEIIELINGEIRVIATLKPGNPAQSELQPPSMIFNGLTIHNDYLYVAGEIEKSLFRIAL
jgi:sugar lactone lactonase YvrE